MLVICTNDSIWGLPVRTNNENVRCYVVLVWYKPGLLLNIHVKMLLRTWSFESIRVLDPNKIMLLKILLPGLETAYSIPLYSVCLSLSLSLS